MSAVFCDGHASDAFVGLRSTIAASDRTSTGEKRGSVSDIVCAMVRNHLPALGVTKPMWRTQGGDLHPNCNRMSHYISLLRFTEQGAANLKKSTARAHNFDKLAAKSGVTVVGQYWTLGEYDGVLILSADSEKKVLHLLSALTGAGNVQTATLQAFTDGEFDDIVSGG